MMIREFLRMFVVLACGCRTPVGEESTEMPCDTVDQDCDGADLTDVDGDGYEAVEVDGDDCDDQDPSVNPGATEVWYDGVDQDCDGSSDYDMDADGYDCAAYVGTDCDDGDPATFPGAPETAYDGIDQDCDGTDLTDVDGDGHDAAEVGGDDCDDEEPTVYPDAPEVAGDVVDQDCDGRIDEYLVCADGTGDFATVQDGIDGVPDGAILELCPGTYEEDLDVSGREIDIEGGGEEPDDVVLRGVSASYHVVTGTGTDVRFYWLAMESDGSGTQEAFLLDDPVALTIDTVALCSATSGYQALADGNCGNGAEIAFTRSYFCDDFLWNGNHTGLEISGGCRITFSQNLVTSASFMLGWFDVERGQVDVTNNLFAGGSIFVGGEQKYDGEATYRVGHNTFTHLSALTFFAWSRDSCVSWWSYDFRLTNNVFSDIDPAWSQGLWHVYVYWETWDWAGDAPYFAPDFSSNLLWSIPTPLARVEMCGLCCNEGMENGGDTTVVSDMMASTSILADPLFTTDTAMGSFALDPASPAVDAGEGEPDPDGTPADLGAFGGPEGDWWQEVPWLLP